MKEITQKELLELENIEKLKVLRQICEGNIKYIGGTENEKKRI